MILIKNKTKKNTVLSAANTRIVILAERTSSLTDEQWTKVRGIKTISTKVAKGLWEIEIDDETAKNAKAEASELLDIPLPPVDEPTPALVVADEIRIPNPAEVKRGRKVSKEG
jgi:hypothetical protein